MINARKCPDPPVGAQTAPGRGWTLAARRRREEAQSGACAPPQGSPTRPPPISRGRAHLARVRARARARAAALAPAPAARVVRLLSSVRAAVYQCGVSSVFCSVAPPQNLSREIVEGAQAAGLDRQTDAASGAYCLLEPAADRPNILERLPFFSTKTARSRWHWSAPSAVACEVMR